MLARRAVRCRGLEGMTPILSIPRIPILSSISSIPSLGSCSSSRMLRLEGKRPLPSVFPLTFFRRCSSSAVLGQKAKPAAPAAKQEYTSVVEQIVSEQHSASVPSTRVQKVVQAGRDFWYIGLLAGAVVVAVGLAWVVFSELFSSNSVNRIYSRALDRVRNSDEVEVVFGSPIAAHGEETSRRRRRHVSSLKFKDEAGRERLRMIFHIKGPFAAGTAQLEMCKDETGTFEFRYLFCETEEMPPKVIVLIDNR